MADIIDMANDTADVFKDAALSNRKAEGPRANGFCHNCGEPVAGGLRFCDADCRDDWQARQ